MGMNGYLNIRQPSIFLGTDAFTFSVTDSQGLRSTNLANVYIEVVDQNQIGDTNQFE